MSNPLFNLFYFNITCFFFTLRWLWRQRIRLYLEGTGINPVPVDLHEQQLSLNQHSRAFNIERIHDDSRWIGNQVCLGQYVIYSSFDL